MGVQDSVSGLPVPSLWVWGPRGPATSPELTQKRGAATPILESPMLRCSLAGSDPLVLSGMVDQMYCQHPESFAAKSQALTTLEPKPMTFKYLTSVFFIVITPSQRQCKPLDKWKRAKAKGKQDRGGTLTDNQLFYHTVLIIHTEKEKLGIHKNGGAGVGGNLARLEILL